MAERRVALLDEATMASASGRLIGCRSARPGQLGEWDIGIGQAPVSDLDAVDEEALDRAGDVHTLTFIPATIRSSASQNAMNSRPAGSPRKTTRSDVRARPEYSIPTSYWSEKKHGRREKASARPSMLRAAAGPWWRALAQCSTRIGSP